MSYLGNLPLKSLSNPLYHASSHEKLKEIQINEGLKENGDEQKMLSNVILRKVKKKKKFLPAKTTLALDVIYSIP